MANPQCPHGRVYGTCLMCYHDLVSEQRSEIEQMRTALKVTQQARQERIAELERALKKLGRHPTGDMEGVGRCAGFLRAAPFRDDLCDCGLNAALAGRSGGLTADLPINRALVRALDYCVIPLLEGHVTVDNRSPNPVVVTVDRATVS